MSTERPILVSGPLIGPILRGEKTVTRRLAPIRFDTSQKWGPYDCWTFYKGKRPFIGFSESNRGQDLCIPHCPYGRVGDTLWVRETWCHTGDGVWSPRDARGAMNGRPIYRADGEVPGVNWFPSIHMPRWAARIFLRVESVTVERVQDITEEDARAEGIQPNYTQPLGDNPGPRLDGMWRSRWVEGRKNPRKWSEYSGWPIFPTAREAFADLWDSLAPDGSKWVDNPWVWRIAFKLEVPRG